MDEEIEDASVDSNGSPDHTDHAKVKEIFEKGLKLNASNHIVKVFRIGKPRTESERPRLLKVEFQTVEGKNEALKRAKNLRYSDDFKNVYIVPDLTRKQQEADKILREHVKKFRAEGMEQVMIKKGKVIKNEGGTEVVLFQITERK